ncbi:MAG: DNA alkylation repair protein [bacterium]|nr:DNA alkylation repair protein [bacterium]
MELNNLLESLTEKLQCDADAAYGEKMSAYMKGKFVYYGIPAPMRNSIQKEWFSEVKDAKVDRWELIDALWDGEQREFQYVAIDLLKRTPKRLIVREDLPAIEHLITTKSWWDTVDLIASNYVGAYFQKFPDTLPATIEAWRHEPNLWLNRTCLIFQLKYKEDTDFELMKSLIIQYQGNSEFFIQKAIGWALRQYSKTAPEEVREFVEEIRLEGLARREAVKYL